MSQNIDQIYTTNPAASMQSTDLLYLGRSPYGITDDFAIQWTDMQDSITAVGTIATGVWEGTVVGITYGGTGVSAVTSSPTASAWAGWDANFNLSANNLLPGFATTVTAAGNTILTVASKNTQEFTGSSTQTCTMPVVSTLVTGFPFKVINNSSGAVTVNSSGGNAIQVMAANTTLYLTCVAIVGTGAASWNATYITDGAGVLSITGTANQVIASSATGNVILSTPQDIATTSSPTFAGLNVDNININGSTISSTDVNGNIYAQPNGTGKTFITNVTEPSTAFSGKFAIVTSAVGASQTMTTYSSNSGQSTQLYFARSQSNTPGVFSAVGAAQVLGSILNYGDDGAAFQLSSQISFFSSGAVSAGIVPGAIVFYTANTSGALTSAMNISNAQIVTLANALPVGSGGTGLTSYTANNLIYASGTSTLAGLATANNGVLATNGSGVPSITTTIGADLTINTVKVGLGGNSVSTNVCVGTSALGSGATTGTQCVAVGNGSLSALTSGSFNTGIGSVALQLLTSGSSNTALGSNSLKAVLGGGSNTAAGGFSGQNITSGSNNTLIGLSTGTTAGGGTALTTGSGNTLVGYQSSVNNAGTTGAISLGSGAVSDIATGATSSDNGPGISIGSTSAPVGFRGNGTIYPGNLWRTKINGTYYMIPLAADGSTSLPVANGGTGITSFGTGVATALGQNVTGSGGIVLANAPTFVTGTVTAPSVTFSTTSGIIGTTTNNNAAAGSVGEEFESVILSASAVSLSTTVSANMTSIALGAGDWDVWGNVTFMADTTTVVVAANAEISATSATFNNLAYRWTSFSIPGGTNLGSAVPGFRVSLAAPATIYMVTQSTFSVSTLTVCGGLYARRRR